jgi:hypothetical protein
MMKPTPTSRVAGVPDAADETAPPPEDILDDDDESAAVCLIRLAISKLQPTNHSTRR